MKFLKTYWPALILTAGAAVAYVVAGQGALTAGLLALTAAAWIGIAAWTSSAPSEPAASSKVDRGDVRDAICTIVDRINQFIDEEVGILHGSLEQIQALAKDAVGSLSKSMHSLNHQVQRQSKLLDELSGITSNRGRTEQDPESLSLGKFVDDSQSVIRYFMTLLNELGEQRDSYVQSLAQLKDQTGQLREATAQYTGENARDIRTRIATIRTLTDRQTDRIGQSKTWADAHGDANQAVKRMQDSRDKLQGMRDVVAMSVAAFSTQSSKDVDEAIRSLQFEDIVSQLVAGAQGRLDEVNQLVATLNSRVDRLKVIDAEDEPLGALEVVENIHSDVVKYTERLRASRHQPVGQSSLDEGTVELF